MALFTDDFNRADANPIGGNWTAVGGAGAILLASSKAAGAAGGNCSAYVNSVTPNNDQYAQCAISGTLSGGGPGVRMSTSVSAFYGLQIYGSTTAALFRMDSGFSYNSLTTASITHNAGDVYKITAEGTSIKGYQNGVEILSTTDSTLTGGRAGLYAFSLTSQFDDFEAGNTASGFQAAWARNSNQVIIA